MASTRKQTSKFLVGNPKWSLGGSKLPTNREVLLHFFGIKDASEAVVGTFPSNEDLAYTTIDNVTAFWNMGRIKVKTRRHCMDQLMNLFNEWRNLKKNISRQSATEITKRDKFSQDLDKLFDIAAPDAIDEIQQNAYLTSEQKKEDIEFYIDQKTTRIAYMSGNDKIFLRKIERKREREAKKKARITKEQKRVLQSCANVPHESRETESENGNESSSSSNSSLQLPYKIRRENVTISLPRKIMEVPEITAALDRLGLSNTKGAVLVSAVLKAGNANLNEFSLSESTTRRARMRNRQNIAEAAIENLKKNPPAYATLHWDGKIIKDYFGEKREYLAVIMSGLPEYVEGKILAIPQIESSSGEKQATTAYEVLCSWELENRIVALAFDTTASNTGRIKGAAKLLEEKLGKKLLYLACRHHVFELLAKAAWESLFGATQSPETKLFVEFKESWKNLKKDITLSPIMISSTCSWLQQKKIDAVKVLTTVNKKAIYRDDYKECISNALILLGAKAGKGTQVIKPGAVSEARWMAKILYCNKMLMFATEMGYNKDFVEKLQRINLFLAIFYVPLWIKATEAASAPANDLKFMKDMMKFQNIDRVIAEAVLQKFSNHRWYLTQELVTFALFSKHEDVSLDLKQMLADAICAQEEPESYRWGKPSFSPITKKSTLVDFVGPESLYLFKTLDLSKEWLTERVGMWEMDPNYNKAKEFVTNLKVVNDAAERGVKLISEFATKITTDETQRMWLLQTVEAHRQRIDISRKETLKQPFVL